MCVGTPDIPKARPAPIERPAPVLEQEAPDESATRADSDKKKRNGTDRFRIAGSALSLPTIQNSGGANVPN